MEERLEYMDYTGSVEFSEEDRKYRGKIIGIEDEVMYEGDTQEELAMEFETAVDIYVFLCLDAGKLPDQVSRAN